MFPVLHFSLTVSELALFEHLTEALTEFQVALVLGTFDELFELIGAGLLLLRGLLLVHGLWLLVHGLWLLLVHGLTLVWLLKKQKADGVILHVTDKGQLQVVPKLIFVFANTDIHKVCINL